MNSFFVVASVVVFFSVSGRGQANPSLSSASCAQAPLDLRLASQGALYSCKKVGCDGLPVSEPTPAATPQPFTAQLLCDAGYRLTARFEGQLFSLEEFGTKDRCQRAIEQFKSHKGCYCTPDYAPKCLTSRQKFVKFEEMAVAFSRQDACIQALEQLSQAVEVKVR
jgi:hypothetical protein